MKRFVLRLTPEDEEEIGALCKGSKVSVSLQQALLSSLIEPIEFLDDETDLDNPSIRLKLNGITYESKK